MENNNIRSSPFLHHEDSLRSMMLDMCIAMTPALIWGFYVFGTRSIFITLLSIFFFHGFEFLSRVILKKGLFYQNHSATVSAIIFSLLLPVATPLWIIPIGALLATVFAKGLLSVFGKCFLNPTLFAKGVLLLVFPKQMNLFTEPFVKLPVFDISISEKILEPCLAPSPLSLLKEEPFEPLMFSDLLTGNIPGNIGEISALLLLAGLFYLLIRHVITWHIPTSMLATTFLFSLIFSKGESPLSFAFSALLSGGILLSAMFLATDPTSSPVTRVGMILYGVVAGVGTFLFRLAGLQGVVFAVLIANLLARPFDLLFKVRPYGEKGFFKVLPENCALLWDHSKTLGKTLSEKGKALWKKGKDHYQSLKEKKK